jgi:glycosyltransferase involved in cell wall biosynthesis
MIDKLLLKGFDRIVAISEEVKKELLKAGISQNKITTIDNGINVNRFKEQYDTEKIRNELGIPNDSKVIGTVGRLSPEKGHHILIEVAEKIIKKYPATFFVFAGDGLLKEKLERKAKNLKIENHLLFIGSTNKIPELLSIYDIFVLPSFSEGLPMALLEAMAAKIPIVASRIGSIPKLIIPHQTGLLVEPRDMSSLEKSIIDLINDKNKAIKLAENGYRMILKIFSSKIMTEKYISIYNCLAR